MTQIDIKINASGELAVCLETRRLMLSSITPQSLADYQALLGNAENMALYATGVAWDEARVISRVSNWSIRWQQGDPFSSLVVTLKSTHEVAGHIILTHGDAPGRAELAFVLHKRFWGQGYGREMLACVMEDYIPALIQRGYALGKQTLQEVVATCTPQNIASRKLLEGAGMHYAGEEFSYGHQKLLFFLTKEEILKRKENNQLPKSIVLPAKII